MSDTEALSEAIEAARANPADEAAWDTVEDLAGELESPDEVASLYREVLSDGLAEELREALAQRAVQFHEEWFAEDSPVLAQVLEKVLALDPRSDWAFQRLTVVHTTAGRWDDLLALYDSAIDAAEDPDRKAGLLDEAANVAKDFASAPDRAIGYMQRLLPLRARDTQLAAQLERLLEREERWQDLIGFWRQRLEGIRKKKDVQALRVRIARTQLEKLDEPGAALEDLRALLDAGGGGDEAVALLEAVSNRSDAPDDVRRGALSLLKGAYAADERVSDVVRTLDASLALAGHDEKIALHREAAERLSAQDPAAAIEHWAALLELDPSSAEAVRKLRELADRTGGYEELSQAFENAADKSEGAGPRIALRVDAGDVRRDKLGDADNAVRLYQQVLAEEEIEDAVALKVARRLVGLLQGEDAAAPRLAVLEQLAVLEPEVADRRAVIGQAARAAEELGDPDRALASWQRRLADDEHDLEALDAMISILEREARWAELVAVLLRRASAPGPRLRRRIDLVHVAKVQAEEIEAVDDAIETWKSIAREFGEDAEVVDSLAGLLSDAERWTEVAELYERAADREAEHVGSIYSRIGDVQREQLGSLERAAKGYAAALRIDPAYAPAREGLLALLEEEGCRDTAVEALAGAYEVTDEWQKRLELLEHRLGAATDVHRQVRLLREAAAVHETRGEDRSAALHCMRRAMALAPDMRDIEGDVLRLAEETTEWSVALAAVREAIENLEDNEPRKRYLRFWEGTIAEKRLDDPEAALEAYARVLEGDRGRGDAAEAVIRTAARVGRWDQVARTVVLASAHAGAVSEGLVDVAGGAAREAGAWDRLTTSLARAIAETDDVPAAVARDLERLVARLYVDELDDRAAAEEALRRAVAHDDAHPETLRALAELSRASGGRPLYDTLLRLADLADDDLDPLREATETAIALEDADLAQATADRLYREASRLWKRGATAGGRHQPEACTRWALDRLVEIYRSAGDAQRAVALLADAALLPVGAEASRDLRGQAAAVAAQAGDRPRAIALYRGILDEAPDDQETLGRLADLCEQEENLPEMLTLRQRELALCEDAERRLTIRLDLARIVGELEARGGRVEALKANLDERPGHDESIAAITEVLESGRRYGSLADLLTEQAGKLEQAGEGRRAAPLWAKVASLSEQHLRDVDRALSAHRKVVELSATRDALDALARLHTDRGEHAAAAQWLERRLNEADETERTDVALRLARAHLGAEQPGRAVSTLERALESAPERQDVREMLAAQYRAAGSAEPLARLLTEAAPHVDDEETLLAYAREAAELCEKLGAPDRAVPVLEKAAAAAPKERDVRMRLAEGLLVAERHDEAREILHALVESYGRRRNAERAGVHFLLAKVERAAGDLDAALEQLELAAKMDASRPVIQRMLGEAAHQAGQLDRAERAYRALLLLVRRQPPTADDPHAVGASEVQYELHRIAKERGEEEQADELFESALETAVQNEQEVRRLTRTLLEHGEPELALRALDRSLEQIEDAEAQAVLLAQAAMVLDGSLDRTDEALDRILAAVDRAPADAAVHEQARALANEAGGTARYAKALEKLADRADDPALRSELLLRLGLLTEEDLEDLDEAASLYARVEELGQHVVESWMALARVAGRRGDTVEETRVLEQIVQSDDIAGPARVDAMYRLAEVLLADPERRDGGVEMLARALERDPRNTEAGAMLRAATDRAVEHDRMLGLYERVARASGDPELLLDFLDKRARRPDATLGEVREGVDLATEHGELERAERLLERGAELANDTDEGLAGALWVPQQLAERRRAAGDIPGAVRCMREAAEAVPDDDSFELWLEAAGLAASEGGDLELAADTYERLLARDPMDRRVWEPLLGVLRRRGDEDRLNDLCTQLIDGLLDPEPRNAARTQRALFLLDQEGREPDAADVLRAILDEDPENQGAGRMLADLFERTGYDEDLVDLLSRQLDVARDNQDSDTIRDLSLRLGALLEKVRREDAMDVYRRALDWLPEDREIAQALLAQLGPDDEPRERIEVMERLLATEQGGSATRLALDLAAEWERLEEPDGVRRSLELGYRGNPEDRTVRERLEAFYREREEWGPLAELMVSEASRIAHPETSVPLCRGAAGLWRDTLGDAHKAAKVLAQALELVPTDVEVLTDLAQTRAQAGDHQTAIDEITQALEQAEDPSAQASLLRLRAGLRMPSGDDAGALEDLERAFGLGGREVLDDLVGGLTERKERLADRGDAEAERAVTLRLVQVLSDAGRSDEARAFLTQWIGGHPDDREALYLLRDVDEAAESWAALADTCALLVQVEEGEAQIEAALRLADASDKAGTPSAARPGLEHVYRAQPEHAVLRNRLRALYRSIGANAELAHLLLQDARETEDQDARYDLLRQAGDLFLQSDDPSQAVLPLEEAVRLRPDDHAVTILLVDGYISAERFADAGQLLEQAIAAHTRRRSPELAELQHRMAHLARAAGDPQLQLQWLNAAMDSDKNNGYVAAELAQLAMELNDYDTALNALRVVTLNKSEGPMSRGMAFLLQARIAHERGEARRALLWARKARSEDPELEEAAEFLRVLGEA